MSGDGKFLPNTPQNIWQVYKVPLILGCISLLCIALSITIFIKSYQRVAPITFSSDRLDATVSGSVATDPTGVMIDIEGAVRQPGVYRLPANSRLDDAISAAGGLDESADTERVAVLYNRAAKLTDGSKIYIPVRGQQAQVSAFADDGQQTSGSTEASGGVANINSASQSELEALPGVGPVTAGKIMNGRPYLRLEELVEKKAINRSLFEKLKNQLVL